MKSFMQASLICLLILLSSTFALAGEGPSQSDAVIKGVSGRSSLYQSVGLIQIMSVDGVKVSTFFSATYEVRVPAGKHILEIDYSFRNVRSKKWIQVPADVQAGHVYQIIPHATGPLTVFFTLEDTSNPGEPKENTAADSKVILR